MVQDSAAASWAPNDIQVVLHDEQRVARILQPVQDNHEGLGVRRVVYVACDASALARDARALLSAGFRPESVQVVDMFPQTRHVEAVMAFSRVEPA